MAKTFDSFKLRPFPVAKASANYEWTAEDGRSPDVIDDLAHNPLEEERMIEENERIKRRQLVYIKQTVAALFEQARLSGQKVQSIVLPGLDGQEFQVQITSEDLQPSQQIGMLYGVLEGQPESRVALAYKFGREAFMILSPADGNNLIAEAREPGQVIVKSIDPAVYAPGVCGDMANMGSK